MTHITPYLHFTDGRCRAAMTFYQTVFGGELSFDTVSESAAAAQFAPDAQDKIMHASLSGADFRLFGSDWLAPNKGNAGTLVRVCVTGLGDKTIATFNALMEGGTVHTPIAEMFFGVYGDGIDAFGVSWIFQADAPAPVMA